MEESSKKIMIPEAIHSIYNMEIFSPSDNFIVKMINKSSNIIPIYETSGSAGFDIASNEDTVLYPGETKLISTGLFMEVPEGFELQIRSRSGLSIKYQVIVLNSPGCIDSDYRGEIKIILINLGCNKFEIKTGDRIAQGTFSQIFRANFKLVDKLSETERGSGGFGSTGI